MNTELARLRWQCRRGMRELDQLLLAYLEREYVAAADAQKSAFRLLLELPDPELIGYLLKREPVPEPFRHVVSQLLQRPQS